MRRFGTFCFVAVLANAVSAGAQPAPTLAEVLKGAGEYVANFERQLGSIVAEEQDVQELMGSWPSDPSRRMVRRLKSDLLLVRPQGGDRWVEFRDVFEVDGKPVRDRDERLARLFLRPSPSTAGQFGRIVAESARYNIGHIERTLNVPVLTLMFLDPTNQSRFTFTRSENDGKGPALEETIATTGARDSAHFAVSTEVWVLRFQEVRPKTLIRTNRGRDLPARGRFWIEPATGRVLMSEVVFDSALVRARIDVSYQSTPLLGLLVPIEMRETYTSGRERIHGAATYMNFRQFQVKVDERLSPIEK